MEATQDHDLLVSTITELKQDYLDVKILPDGSIAALGELLTTRAIYLGVTRLGWARRFCFADRNLAVAQFKGLQGEDDEPQGWIARRPEAPCSQF